MQGCLCRAGGWTYGYTRRDWYAACITMRPHASCSAMQCHATMAKLLTSQSRLLAMAAYGCLCCICGATLLEEDGWCGLGDRGGVRVCVCVCVCVCIEEPLASAWRWVRSGAGCATTLDHPFGRSPIRSALPNDLSEKYPPRFTREIERTSPFASARAFAASSTSLTVNAGEPSGTLMPNLAMSWAPCKFQTNVT
eukprot:356376-Chlamydomonas_euryale.AAC.3